MNIIFYSNKCNNCIKILKYLNTIDYKLIFKLINIDENFENNKIKELFLSIIEKKFSNISDELINELNMPILINPNLNQILKGDDAFKYISNIKYFNISTNNIKSIIPDNPIINNDDKALNKDNNISLIIEEPKNNNTSLIIEEQKDKQNEKRIIPQKKFQYYLLQKKK